MPEKEWPTGLLPLTSFVEALRAELKEARATADPSLLFAVGPVTVEMNVVAKREAAAKFGAKFWAILDAGAEAKVAKEATHKVTLTLTPWDPTQPGGDVYVGDPTASPPPLPQRRTPSPPPLTPRGSAKSLTRALTCVDATVETMQSAARCACVAGRGTAGTR